VSPELGSYLEWWAMFREGNDVFIQNQMLIYARLDAKFSVQKAVDFLKDREVFTEEGQHMSEWSVNIIEIQRFLERVQRSDAWRIP
jgi:hypothetical protein